MVFILSAVKTEMFKKHFRGDRSEVKNDEWRLPKLRSG
jgi:hypothetical protein